MSLEDSPSGVQISQILDAGNAGSEYLALSPFIIKTARAGIPCAEFSRANSGDFGFGSNHNRMKKLEQNK